MELEQAIVASFAQLYEMSALLFGLTLFGVALTIVVVCLVSYRLACRVIPARESLPPPRFDGVAVALLVAAWLFGEVIFGQLAILLAGSWAATVAERIAPAAFAHCLSSIITAGCGMLAALAAGAFVRIACLAFGIGVLVVHRQGPADIGLDGRSVARGLRDGAIAFLCVMPGWVLLSEVWGVALFATGFEGEPQSSVQAFQVAVVSGQFAVPLAIFFSAVFVAPLLEELLFRGFLLTVLASRMDKSRAALASAVIFALFHLNVQVSVPIALLGLALAWVYLRTASLWACFATHALFNLAQSLNMILGQSWQ